MILKKAEDPTAFTHNLHFTSSARKAWGHLLKQVNAAGQGNILLPAYIGYTDREGSGVFDPVEETNTPFEFYPVNERLGFDLKVVENMLAQGGIKLMLVIHYFGFCQTNIEEVAALCKRYDVLLVEDCAHAFQLGIPWQQLGNKGDFSFYSLHKYLATDSGGILKVNNNSINIPPVPQEDKVSSEILEQYIKTDLLAVAEKRRANYILYEQLLKGVAEIKPLYGLSKTDVPHNFPLKVGAGKREKLYFYLMEKGMPTIALYYRLINAIHKEQFPVSFKVADEILNLPVHQDTTEEDVRKLCSEIKLFFQSEAV